MVTLHKRKCVTVTMQLLYEVISIEKCLKQISLEASGTNNKSPKVIITCVERAQHVINNIKTLSVQFSDRRTLLAHRLLEKEGHRPTTTPTPLRKSNIRSSLRHANNVKKRKFTELDTTSIKSSLHDLFQAGRLRRTSARGPWMFVK